MSDKLLHERLREVDEECSSVLETLGMCCTDFLFCDNCLKKVSTVIADEIERQYIPVPRFPDGEPVREGSETFYGTVSVVIVEMSDDTWGNWVIRLNDGNCIEGTFSKRVERPAPDVLGADGLPVVEGETVWDTESGKELSVCAIANADAGMIQCSDDDYVCEDYDAYHLTHTPPDSLEKLRQFASEWAHTDNVSNSSAGDYRDAMQEVSDRITALMERGA